MSSKSSAKELKHPYYPWDLKLKGYVPNDMSAWQFGGIWAAIIVLIIIVGWILSGRRKEQFCFMRRMALCWFLLCAFIHTIVEGYYAVYHKSIAGHTSFLGQSWKEYSKGDSRYIASDTLMVCNETIKAAIVGPLAFIAFFAFITGSNYRYMLQLTLSLFQLYGFSLYLLTEMKDGLIHGPGPKGDSKYFFYFYFLSCNLFWIIVPVALIIDAWEHMAACQRVSDFYIDEYNRKHTDLAKKIK